MSGNKKADNSNATFINVQIATSGNNINSVNQEANVSGGNNDDDKTDKPKQGLLAKIIAALATVCTISGISVWTVWQHLSNNDISSNISSEISVEQNEVFLHSEYSKITIYQETNMTATLNFEADSVVLTAYLASGKSDSLDMSQKNSTEWVEKVIFNEVGVHEIQVTATAPNGDVFKNSIEVEVVPISIDFNDLLDDNTLL